MLAISGNLANTIGKLNPFRYRSYVYDDETGLYYLNSRYYDAGVGRFLNADGYASTGQSVQSCNMFAYCENNPVNRCDPSGQFWLPVIAAIALVAVCTVVASGCSAPQTSPLADYVQDNSATNNCYSYAFGLPEACEPGEYSAVDTDLDYMYKDKNIYTPEEITEFVQRDMQAYGKEVTVLKSLTDKKDGEYIVAMKTSTIVHPALGRADYHFAVLLSDGTWADKQGHNASTWNQIDGYAVAWNMIDYPGYYDTKTVYFAVRR